jgi:heterodisulfide reductase subunit A-like polyferredoxin
MAVLSVGLRPPKSLSKLAGTLDIALNEYGFVRTDPTRPLVTSREGIYVSGAAESPKDIPETVMQSSGAACEATSLIADVRGRDLVVLKLPEEKNVDEEEPRIGVFICNCGINIGGVVNVPEVQAYAKTLPNVVLSDENLFTCSQDTQDKMKKVIDDTGSTALS